MKLGVIRVRSAAYTIYYLEFSNPISLHGQSRISIIKNDRQFMGSYECDDLWLGRFRRRPDDATYKIGKDRLTVTVPIFGSPRHEPLKFVIRFTEHGPTRNKYFCGEGSGWHNTI
jgi:hypothetical protein